MNKPLIRVAGSLYSLAWTLIRPLLRRSPRLADGFAERLAPPDWAGALTGGVDVWVQAASGGEARLACALLQELAASGASARLCIMLTTWTRQGRDILEAGIAALPADGPVRAVARFVPFDDPALMRTALAQANPRLVVLLETEIWPGLLLACREAGVPVLLANGRLRDRTLRNYLRCAALWRAMPPDRITAISEADAGRFRRLFPFTPCTVIDNIKFDQAALSHPAQDSIAPVLDLPPLCSLLTAAPLRPVVLFASVREEEEEPLRAVLRELSGPDEKDGKIRLIVAPRHMHRIAAWGVMLDALGLTWTRRSAPGTVDADVVLWDAFGELAWLYHMADAVFVGGSLAPLGGQNFLEALAAGTTPFVGPHLGNFAWALVGEAAGLTDLGLLTVTPDAPALCAGLRAAIARGPLTQADRSATRCRFADWLAPRQGGTAAQVGVILDMLRRSPA
ncbi:MAG: 3-deoxy-D-manno-octulosonic acid transferase [Deltaproteobacteria bacterium]|jgi:3-deoxy-D-manno-octulosonic-acid transferase|nr:3-deoxy-D-manno-octulosonic acid transferase [Deltaproteobacteria bacterium]